MQLSRLRAEEAPFLVSKYSPLLLHIIDDAAVITMDWPTELITVWHKLTRNILRVNLLPVAEKKSSHPLAVIQDTISFTGCTWNLKLGTITPSSDKLERVTACLKMLLRSQTCATKDWERVIGKLLWFAMLNRPLLVCTNSIFKTGYTSQPSLATTITPCHRRELRTLTALLLLSRVDAQLAICHVIVAFDASMLAGAVTYAYAPADIAEKLWKAAQNARFSRNAENHSQLHEVSEVIQQCQWKLAFVHYWRKEEHINCLEAATAVLAAEWLTRFRMSTCRAIFLTDSLVTLGDLQKGRSSQTGIMMRCRRFAALVLAHDLRIAIAFVRSAMNPADEYTRIPEGHFLQSSCAELVTN